MYKLILSKSRPYTTTAAVNVSDLFAQLPAAEVRDRGQEVVLTNVGEPQPSTTTVGKMKTEDGKNTGAETPSV